MLAVTSRMHSHEQSMFKLLYDLLFIHQFFFFFFFKQKTAYEIASCLVGSEMCKKTGLLGHLCVALAILQLTL